MGGDGYLLWDNLNALKQIINNFMMKNIINFGLSALLMGSSFHIAALEEMLLADDFLVDLLPVVSSVTGIPQKPSQLPVSVMVIDRAMLDAAGIVDIAEAFRLVPGFLVGNINEHFGSRSVVSYHGLSDQFSRRMQVMIDGQSIYLPLLGGLVWEDLPISVEDIDRIEVTRGSNGAGDGMNAFMGVIHIITRHSAKGNGFKLSALRDTRSDQRYRAEASERFGDLSLRLSYRFEESEGFDEGPNGVSAPKELEMNDDSRTSVLNLRADYQLNINNHLELYMGRTSGPREVGFYNDVPETHNQILAQTMQMVKYRSLIDTESEWGIELSNINSNLEDFAPAFGTIFDGARLNKRQTISVNYLGSITPELKMASDLEYRSDRVKADIYLEDDREWFRNDTKRFSINMEWSPHHAMTINIGNMYETSDDNDQLNSPRIALSFSPSENHYLRLALSRAYRPPTFFEHFLDYKLDIPGLGLFPIMNSVDDLSAEQMDSMELVWGGQFKDLHIDYEVRLFEDKIENILAQGFVVDVNTNSNGIELFKNAGEATIKGGELWLKKRLAKDHFIQLAYSALSASGFIANRFSSVDSATLRNIDVKTLVPTSITNLLYSIQLTVDMQLGISYSRVSNMDYMAGDFTNGYEILDITQNIKMGPSGRWGNLQLRMRNLMGSYHDFEDETVSKPFASIAYDVTF